MKLRSGGLLTGHDYAINRDASGEWGVRKAVDEFSENADRPLETGSDGTWCIER